MAQTGAFPTRQSSDAACDRNAANAPMVAGHAKLEEIASTGRAIVLLCGCADVTVCHRKPLAEGLAQAWQRSVQHLTPPDNRINSGQMLLF